MTDTWRTNFRIKRELDPQELTEYDRYCEYCERIGCEPAPEETWGLVNRAITPQSL